MTNFLEVGGLQIFNELIPPVVMVRLAIGPILDLELGQLDGQVHDSNRDDLGLPLETQRGAETAAASMEEMLNFETLSRGRLHFRRAKP